mmetsp:Transcript_4044/g.5581  ORF Transcript_4044/g.5581 Transcript_4044/m.5581 type:complete len:551 (-) Transcript_4044:60-1712(-)
MRAARVFSAMKLLLTAVIALALLGSTVNGESLREELRIKVTSDKGKKPKSSGPIYSNKPRVRREWRTLSDEMRARVANAYWTIRNLTTAEGQKLYGEHFHNHDEFIMLHACAVMSPRCDQGHFGPQFMTFHRALLLKYELALLAVDPKIEAMPYWHIAFDSVDGKYRNDPDNYIFTDKFFGSLYGDESQGYAVTDGLFAYWPISEYSSKSYGKKSTLAKDNVCIREEWFRPSKCSDNKGAKTYIRNHEDCTPYLARDPADPAGPNVYQLGGTYEMVYTVSDFESCSNPKNIGSWMAWQNCIELGTVQCIPRANALMTLTGEEVESLKDSVSGLKSSGKDAALASMNALASAMQGGEPSAEGFPAVNCSDPMLVGYYTSKNKRTTVNFFHSQAHVKLGKDLLDVTTSPNDAAGFTGYHADIDRSNMIWMAAIAEDLEERYWLYPSAQGDLVSYGGKPPYGSSGPFSTYDIASCTNNSAFYEYTPLESPWLPGTMLNDVVNYGFPFFNLFECSEDESCDGGEDGYTHQDMLYWTAPSRTPYTYDTLEHLYYD